MKQERLKRKRNAAADNVHTNAGGLRCSLFPCVNLFLFISLLYSLAAQPLAAQLRSAAFEKYIRQYSHLAVQEEQKYKIPASITLAQALLESAAGQSLLARESNNHFGIKCHEWDGKRYYKDAEKPNECFRKYGSVADSYRDHSLFLTGRPRYAPLFDLKKTDYVKWAKGLQSCGYATDKQYAGKLIRLIETYDLHRYDKMKDAASGQPHAEAFMRASGRMNGLNYVVVRKGDTFESLARELDMKPKKLAALNEAPLDFTLRDGDYIYLEKKKRKAAKPYYSHQVKTGESMYIISQRYGIRLKNLYKMNHREETFVPEVGELLKLR